MKTRWIAFAAAFSAFGLFVACSSNNELPPDDAGVDSGVQKDSSTDTGKMDTGSQQDTGTDASVDTGTMESGADAAPGYNFMAVRVGGSLDGGVEASLTNASAPVFLEERQSSDGMLVRTIPMPTMANGNNQPLTIGGSSITEGGLTRSDDGKYVVMFGYASAPGVAAIAGTASMTTNRVVGRVDSNAAIDTSTRINAGFDTASVRGAASKDGTAFWASGASGQAMSGGVWYVTLGAQGGTQIYSTVTNMRQVGVFGGQLYGTTQSGNQVRIISIGTGLPTMANQTGTMLPGVTTMATAPNGFVMLDLNNQVNGVDTMYVADDAATNAGGGVQKWTFDGMNWSLKGTFADSLSAGVNHVTADIVGQNVVVVAVTAEPTSRIVRYVDDGQNLMPMATALATAQPGTQFRGIALSPK